MDKVASAGRVRARAHARIAKLVRALFVAGLCSPAWATTFTVTNTNDSGAGSLRQAIIGVNADTTDCSSGTLHSIVFAIPGSGPHIISPLSPLPAISGGVVIDGYSQAGSSANTLSTGSNAVLQIVLSGASAGAGADGLVFLTQTGVGARACGPTFSTVSGLNIRSFSGAAIASAGSGLLSSIRIRGNFIGTNETGTAAAANGASGKAAIEIGTNTSTWDIGYRNSADGGPASGTALQGFRNVISGNAFDGVRTSSANVAQPAQNISIRGNLIGLNAAGTAIIGNQRNGVFLDSGSGRVIVEENFIAGNGANGLNVGDTQNNFSAAIENFVGMTTTGGAAGNLGHGMRFGGTTTLANVQSSVQATTYIANNAGAGVYIEDNAIVSVLTTIANNGGLGIDLAPLGVNPNDAQDPDTGPNGLQNRPVLTSASSTNNNVQGTINTTPNTHVVLTFYRNDACDASGFGEGQFGVGSGGGGTFQDVVGVDTDASGNASFNTNLGGTLPAGKFLTAKAMVFVSGVNQTSEFSNCVLIAGVVANPGTLQFSNATYSAGEAGGTASILVTRTGGSSGAVSAQVATSNGSATAGSDYTATTATVSFADGDTATKSVAIPIIDDTQVEGNETVNLALSNATGGATLGAPSTAVLTIIDNDSAVLPTLSIGNVTSTEGNAGTKPFVFTVSLSAASTQTVTVGFATANGSAAAGSDYAAASGTLSFAPGATTATVSVDVIGDTSVEPNETFVVNLSGASNATIAKAQGTGTIIDDDGLTPPGTSITQIPTLGEWAMMSTIALLALLGAMASRRRGQGH